MARAYSVYDLCGGDSSCADNFFRLRDPSYSIYDLFCGKSSRVCIDENRGIPVLPRVQSTSITGLVDEKKLSAHEDIDTAEIIYSVGCMILLQGQKIKKSQVE